MRDVLAWYDGKLVALDRMMCLSSGY
uniref:Uncharacterized protein n=1 Tax=Anguilla anguilla TaxID=7936 RepID=A0A0E9RPC0_ANGAN